MIDLDRLDTLCSELGEVEAELKPLMDRRRAISASIVELLGIESIAQPASSRDGTREAPVMEPESGEGVPPATRAPADSAGGEAQFSSHESGEAGSFGTSSPASPEPPADPLRCRRCLRPFNRSAARGSHERFCRGRTVADALAASPRREVFLCSRCSTPFNTREEVRAHEDLQSCAPIPTRPPAGRPSTRLPGSAPDAFGE